MLLPHAARASRRHVRLVVARCASRSARALRRRGKTRKSSCPPSSTARDSGSSTAQADAPSAIAVAAVAATAAATGGAAAAFCIGNDDEGDDPAVAPLHWAAAALGAVGVGLAAVGVAALTSRGGIDCSAASAAESAGTGHADDDKDDDSVVTECCVRVLEQPSATAAATTALATTAAAAAATVATLANPLRTRVSWGVASTWGNCWYMEDESCAGVVTPFIAANNNSSTSADRCTDTATDASAAGAPSPAPSPAAPAPPVPTPTKSGGGGDGNGSAGFPAAGATAPTGTTAGQSPAASLPLAPLFVAAVFDGHGGGTWSKLAAAQLLPLLAARLTRASDAAAPAAALRGALCDLDARMVGDEALDSGTTAVVVAVTSAGELVVVDGRTTRTLSEDHTPNGLERLRVEHAGGVVRGGAWPDSRQRVYLGEGPHRNRGGLSMTRSLGDKMYKQPPFVHTATHPIVTAEPTFQHHTLGAADAWCILASDGLWDVLTPKAVGQFVASTVAEHRNDPQVVAERLVRLARDKGTSDNTTVLAVHFDHAPVPADGDDHTRTAATGPQGDRATTAAAAA